jgi:hypothetical protein
MTSTSLPQEYEFTLLDGSTRREVISDPATIFERIKAHSAVTARAVKRADGDA